MSYNAPVNYGAPGNVSMPCPRCGSPSSQKVSWTWWGGFLGPRLFNEVKCLNCGQAFNGKTGQLNTNNVILYSVGGFVISFICIGAICAVAALASMNSY